MGQFIVTSQYQIWCQTEEQKKKSTGTVWGSDENQGTFNIDQYVNHDIIKVFKVLGWIFIWIINWRHSTLQTCWAQNRQLGLQKEKKWLEIPDKETSKRNFPCRQTQILQGFKWTKIDSNFDIKLREKMHYHPTLQDNPSTVPRSNSQLQFCKASIKPKAIAI